MAGRAGEYAGHCELDVIDGADAAGDARAIAARIRELCDSQFAVREGDATRPCNPGDFCILLRSRVDFAIYQSALQEAGIPVYADTAADLLDAPHVRPFAALLEVIDNPAQDVALTAVLLSPMFPFTPDDLIHLRQRARSGSLYGAVLSGQDPAFREFARQLADFRRLARALPVDALIQELFARTGYLAAVGAMPDGARCRGGPARLCRLGCRCRPCRTARPGAGHARCPGQRRPESSAASSPGRGVSPS